MKTRSRQPVEQDYPSSDSDTEREQQIMTRLNTLRGRSENPTLRVSTDNTEQLTDPRPTRVARSKATELNLEVQPEDQPLPRKGKHIQKKKIGKTKPPKDQPPKKKRNTGPEVNQPQKEVPEKSDEEFMESANQANQFGSSEGWSSDEETPPYKKQRYFLAPQPIVTVQQGIKLESVPTFDPKERKYRITQWIQRLEQLQKIYKWNENSLIYHMQARLRGTAKAWYDTLENIPTTWIEWKAVLEKMFTVPGQLATDIEHMRQRVKKKEETYEEYFFAKLSLLRPCGLQPEAQVGYIIDGIMDRTIRINAYGRGFQTPEELRSHLLITGLEVTPKNLSTEEDHKKMRKHGKHQNQNFNDKRERGACHLCGKRGHYIKDCWHNKDRAENDKVKKEPSSHSKPKEEERKDNRQHYNRRSRDDQHRFHKDKRDTKSNTACFVCRKEGHVARECPLVVKALALQEAKPEPAKQD